MRAGPPRALAEAFGVTRLARLTGLDRLGVEVVGAVRPYGHVLQVSQGKGRTLAQAQWSALGEAIELAAAETPEPFALREKQHASDPFEVGDLRIAWATGHLLGTREPVEVPAEAVYCPPAGTSWLGPSVTRWQSNGLGAHPTSRTRAVRHAVSELLERDALARALPEGWTKRAATRTLVRSPPWVDALEARGFRCFLFDLTLPKTDGFLAGALIFDLESEVVPLTAGYALRPTWKDAADGAFLEAAQSRLTEIHGAREDVVGGVREAGAELLRALERAVPRPAREGVRPLPAKSSEIVIVDLRAKPFVVKAVSATHRVSELL